MAACNGLPKFNDTSDGIYRRLFLLRFNKIYRPANELARITNPEKKGIFLADKSLFDKIRAEKQAIFNLFLEGYKRLKANDYQFTVPERQHNINEEYRIASDTIYEFLTQNYVESVNVLTPIEAVYEDYKLWYRDNVQDGGSFKLRINEFSRRIKEVFKIESERTDILHKFNLKRMTCYRIRRNDAVDEVQQEINF